MYGFLLSLLLLLSVTSIHAHVEYTLGDTRHGENAIEETCAEIMKREKMASFVEEPFCSITFDKAFSTKR